MQIYNPSHLKLSRVYPESSDIPSTLRSFTNEFGRIDTDERDLRHENDVLWCTVCSMLILILLVVGLLSQDEVCTSHIRNKYN